MHGVMSCNRCVVVGTGLFWSVVVRGGSSCAGLSGNGDLDEFVVPQRNKSTPSKETTRKSHLKSHSRVSTL